MTKQNETVKKPRGGKKETLDLQTAGLKEMILAALNEAGGVAYLTEQAQNNPNGFLGLIKSVLSKGATTPAAAEQPEPIVIRIRGLKDKE